MTKTAYLSALPVLCVALLCIWAIMLCGARTEAKDHPLAKCAGLEAMNLSGGTGFQPVHDQFTGKMPVPPDAGVVKQLEEALVRASLRPGKHPERETLADKLKGAYASPEGRTSRLGGSGLYLYRTLVIYGSVAALVTGLLVLVVVFVRLRRLKASVGSSDEDMLGVRRHATAAAVGVMVAGFVAGGFCLAVGLRGDPAAAGAPVVVMAGALHGVVGVLLLLVAAWITSFASLKPTKEPSDGSSVLLLCALISTVLMLAWGLMAGAWCLHWYATVLFVWLVLSVFIARYLLRKADRKRATEVDVADLTRWAGGPGRSFK